MSAPTGTERPAAGPLVISETFGPTFQGEGPSLGRRCSFLRLGGCNLACSWCDTPYSWDWTGRSGRRYDPRVELRRLTAEEAWDDLAARDTDMLVVTGGEPMLQQPALVPLLRRCREAGWWLEVETAGTIAPTAEVANLVDQFNVSPKLSNSGNAVEDRYRGAAIDALMTTGRAVWKFVAAEAGDLDEIAGLVLRHGLRPVYVMPEGVDARELTERAQRLAGPVLERGWNLTTRLHVLLYGNRRGV